ncbi:hypothetical protein BGZ65_002647 [Modicella reniformis]|uniref:Uncharacterized protein n=1 Tax=Modicella reniformis TaxID=1440133 RepID=A0A9P6M268_9FUNG|nr:hypothetical protein BGZ65_002647 [Modicella reniformis]
MMPRRLAVAIFGDRPTKTNLCAIGYLVDMRLSPAPSASEFASFIRARLPDTQQSTLATIWLQFKEYFGSDDTTVPEDIRDLMDVQSTINGFRDASYLEPEEPAISTTSALSPPITASSPSSSRRSSSSGSTNSNTLGPAATIKMREEFEKHYVTFGGSSWQLTSNAEVDQVVAEHIRTLPYESTLHSFIIENVNTILHLFPAATDKDELKKVLVERSGEGLVKLSAEELHCLNLYDKPPRDLDKLLAGGWANLTMPAEGPTPDDEFRRIVHCCLQHIHLIYKQGGFSLPREQSESWFVNKLWGFMNIMFDSEGDLDHQPGEVSSQSSSLRKNRGRTFEKLLPGRKTDGLISAAVTRLEICTIEAAKKDNGASKRCQIPGRWPKI